VEPGQVFEGHRRQASGLEPVFVFGENKCE